MPPPASDSTAQAPATGRRIVLVLGGLSLLLFAAALLLIGRRPLVDERPTSSVEFEQVPEFEPDQTNRLTYSRDHLAEAGDISRNFLLEDLDGNPHELYALRGQPVVINFWATWCVPCRIEMPILQAAYDKYQQNGLAILAVDFDESPNTVRTFFYDELGLTFTPLLDEGGLVAEQYGVFNFPSTFFVEPGGRIAAVHRGPLLLKQLEEYLAKIMPEAG